MLNVGRACAMSNTSPKTTSTTLEEKFAKLGLLSNWDFALHLPLRYEDKTRITPIEQLMPGSVALVHAEVVRTEDRPTAKGRMLRAVVVDETGELTLTFFHAYSGLSTLLRRGNTLTIFGEARLGYSHTLEMLHPKLQLATQTVELETRLTPIYPSTENLQQRSLRKRIDRALLDLDLTDPVPTDYTQALGLPDFKTALLSLHHPSPDADTEGLQMHTTPEWRRLIFDELLAQQITLRLGRDVASSLKAPMLTAEKAPQLLRAFREQLPFALTRAQERVTQEIAQDLVWSLPMNRLVQGDVGSGKTVVAALAALHAIASGYQVALLAPTEILAEQHYQKLDAWLSPLGLKIVWLAGKMKASEKAQSLATIRSGEAHLVVGTHALIQDGVRFQALGLAIVDEQHRFGVQQRLALRNLSDNELCAHLLMLSATPIPRTLAMSYLADVDVSIIDELPPGRTPIQTKLFRLDRVEEIYAQMNRAVQEGKQIYWVCPLVEESEALDLTPATTRFDNMRHALPRARIGLVHGQLASEDKEVVMKAFAEHRLDILVATTVIEVGVDVPNASIMVIEHAERFGLSQLHQLRGRVGRGATSSSCLLLFGDELTDTAKERLKIIRESTDGFEIARRDLQLRGPGEFLGEKQSGMPFLRFANLDRDEALLRSASEVALRWLTANREAAQQYAQRWFTHRETLLNA